MSDNESIDFEEEFTEFVRDISANPPKTYKNNTFYIDSRDRNVGNETSTFDFIIKFSNTESSVDARIPINLRNIVELNIKDIIIPNFYLNLSESHFLFNENIITSNKTTTNSNNLRPQRLSDLQYIILTIEDLNNQHISGTNNNLVRSSFILKIEDIEQITNINSGNYLLNGNRLVEVGNINNSLLAETDKSRIRYSCKENSKIIYRENDNKIISTMSISISDPAGNKLNYMNDYLVIKKIHLESATNNRLRIEFTEFFSAEEYSLGDTIKISNLVESGSSEFFSSLENFLTTEKNDHIIVGHYGDSENTPISKTKLFNSIYIPLKFTFNKDSTTASGNIFNIQNFGIPNDTSITITSSNKVVNLNNQILVTLKSKTFQIDN